MGTSIARPRDRSPSRSSARLSLLLRGGAGISIHVRMTRTLAPVRTTWDGYETPTHPQPGVVWRIAALVIASAPGDPQATACANLVRKIESLVEDTVATEEVD